MDHPLWFVDLRNCGPVDENVDLAEMLLDLKENVIQRRRIDKESVFAYLSL